MPEESLHAHVLAQLALAGITPDMEDAARIEREIENLTHALGTLRRFRGHDPLSGLREVAK